MQEQSRYAVGVDVGTTMVRCVVGHIDSTTGVPTVVGVGTAPSSGMRKGSVVNLQGPAKAIDEALGEAERMSGYELDDATISINGSHILSTKADGMIAVGSADHAIDEEDLARVEEVATVGKVPANREVLQVIPHSFRLDGQDGIKDPVGMTGTRLEIVANVVSALVPNLSNLRKAAESATVKPNQVVPAVLASARAVLNESQLESGVAVIDLGGSTTSVAVFEEGDLQYVGVVPMGGVNVTNDLAICLKTDPEVAETVKLKHASAVPRKNSQGVSVKKDGEVLSFSTKEIDEVVEARLEEIFEAVEKELQKAGRAGQLPSGVVLTGGGAQMKSIAEFAKDNLGLAVKIGKPTGFGGVAEKVDQPEFSTAVGLMLIDSDGARGDSDSSKKAVKSSGSIMKSTSSKLKEILDKFKA
ncbi:cell division protein FtsA [Candidatus Saccharibacteria bacterium]|nr:MAG: cell division protein FtsA [Candidatus Saccharibacteria bacterium]